MVKSDGRRIFHGVLSGFGLTVVSILVAFIQLRLVLDFLPRAMAGVWLLFLSLATYVAFFDLGISPTLSREVSFLLGQDGEQADQRRKIANLLATCVRTFQSIAVLVFVVGLVAGGAFLSSVAPPGAVRETAIAWALFLFGASLNIVGGSAYASLYGLGDVVTERTSRAFTQLVGLAMSYASLLLGFGVIGMAVSWVVQNLLSRAIALIVLYKSHSWLRQEKGIASLAILKTIAMPSLRWAATGLGAILILQTDNVIIAAVLGPSSIPSYEAIAKIASTLMTLALYIVTSSSPFLSKGFAAGDVAGVTGMVLRNARFTMAAMAFFASFAAVFGDKVIDLWLGAGNFVGFPVMWTLLLMVVLEAHHVSLATATMATGRIAFARAALGAGVLNIAISLVLAHYLGLWGVALGTLIAQLLTNNWYAPYITLQHFHISFTSYAKSVLQPVIIMLLLSSSLDFGVRHLVGELAPIVALPAALIVHAGFSAVVFYFMVLTAQEKDTIVAALYKYIKGYR